MSIYTDKANKVFKKAVKDKEFLISPISKMDVSIIEALCEIINCFDDVMDIMSKYKFIKDSEILSLLEDKKESFANSLNEDEDSEQKEQKEIHFNDIDQNVIKRYFILGYKRAVLYCEQAERNLPCIVLNSCEENVTKLPMFANCKLFYISEDLLNSDIKKLQI